MAESVPHKPRWQVWLIAGLVAIPLALLVFGYSEIERRIIAMFSPWNPPGSGFPAYARFTVDVLFDGKPVRLSRVVVCEQQKLDSHFGPPAAVYRNPTTVSAWVGEHEALFAEVVLDCYWAAGRPDRPPTKEVLGEDFRPLIYHVMDTRTFEDVEAYVSRKALEPGASRITFVGLDIAKASEAEFLESEADPRGWPDTRPFAGIAGDRGKGLDAGPIGLVVCRTALIVPGQILPAIPEFDNWAASLEPGAASGKAFKLPEPISASIRRATFERIFNFSIDIGGMNPKFMREHDRPKTELSRIFSTFDEMHPAEIGHDGIVTVDMTRKGIASCYQRPRGKAVSGKALAAHKTYDNQIQYEDYVTYKSDSIEFQIGALTSIYYVKELDLLAKMVSVRHSSGSMSFPVAGATD